MIFAHFTEFTKVTALFIEAIFASYAIGRNNFGGIDTFNEYWLHKMMLFGSAKDIKEAARKYNVTMVKYSTKSYDLLSAMEDFCTDFINSRNNIVVCKDSFQEYQNRVLHNILAITTLLDLPSKFVQKITPKLIKCVSVKSGVYPMTKDAIVPLLYAHSMKMNKTNLNLFFDLFLTNSQFNSKRIYRNLSQFTQLKNVKLKFPRSVDKGKLIEDCFKVSRSHRSEVIVMLNYVCRIVDDHDFSNSFYSRLLNTLNDEFDIDTYYYCAMHDVTGIEEFEEIYFRQVMNSVSLGRQIDPLDDKEPLNYRVSNFINYAFKKGYDLSKEEYSRIREISEYYKWLLNIEGYDYDKFNLQWLIAYDTIHYRKEFLKHPKLIQASRKLLLENPNTKGAKRIKEMFMDNLD